MNTPDQVMDRLEALDVDLAVRGPALELAARAWFIAKRDKEKARAVAFLSAEGTIAERHAIADEKTATDGKAEEAEWEALRAVCRTIETRVGIGQSLLRAHGRS